MFVLLYRCVLVVAGNQTVEALEMTQKSHFFTNFRHKSVNQYTIFWASLPIYFHLSLLLHGGIHVEVNKHVDNSRRFFFATVL